MTVHVGIKMFEQAKFLSVGQVVSYKNDTWVITKIQTMSFDDVYDALGDRVLDEYNRFDHPRFDVLTLDPISARQRKVVYLQHEEVFEQIKPAP